MDMNGFRYFVALDKYRTISATARKLYLSQPALTNFIKRMEAELGCSLIDRSVWPLKLTRSGEIFLEYARQITRLDQKMHDALEAAQQQEESCVRVCMTSAGATAFMACFPGIHRDCASIRFELIEKSSAECEELLDEKRADICFGTSPEEKSGREFVKIGEIPMVLVMSRDMPALKKYDLRGYSHENPLEICIEDVSGEPFLFTSPDSGVFKAQIKFLKDHELTPASKIQMESVSACCSMAFSGLGVSFLPLETVKRRLFREKRALLAVLKGERLCRDALMIRRAGEALPNPAQYLWDRILQEFESPAVEKSDVSR